MLEISFSHRVLKAALSGDIFKQYLLVLLLWGCHLLIRILAQWCHLIILLIKRCFVEEFSNVLIMSFVVFIVAYAILCPPSDRCGIATTPHCAKRSVIDFTLPLHLLLLLNRAATKSGFDKLVSFNSPLFKHHKPLLLLFNLALLLNKLKIVTVKLPLVEREHTLKLVKAIFGNLNVQLLGNKLYLGRIVRFFCFVEFLVAS